MDAEDLVGKRQSLPENSGQMLANPVYFGRDGKLIYVEHESTQDNVVRLTYQLSGTVVITSQPSAPREERTKVVLAADGVLTLSFGNRVVHYKRVAR